MFDQSEITRRLHNLFRIGTVMEIEGTFARVNIDDNETDLLPWLAGRAGDDRTWHSLSIGEQVVVASIGGDLAQGIIIGSLYRDMHAAPSENPDIHKTVYSDGTEIIYDKSANKLTATLAVGGTAEINAPGGTTWHGDITFTDNVHCEKDISADGDVSDDHSSIQAMRGIYDDHTGHTTGDTKTPQKMGG